MNRHGPNFEEKHPRQHAITVGDLCYVALGQIVNRNYSAARYQPTGGLVINSPSYSERLRKAIVRDWKTFTKEEHKKLLVQDFEKPDYEGRRVGAYLRLAFYYPETVERLVLKELSRPTYDVFKVEALCRDTLYKTDDREERKKLYREFIRKNGEASASGIQEQLFEDLDTLEAHEENRISPPLTRFSTQPRELLID